MDNPQLKNLAMFIVLAARRWMKSNIIPEGHKLYMACRLDCDRIPIGRPWPIFTATSDYMAWLIATSNWPANKHIVSIDMRPKIHPRTACKEI